MIYLIINLLKIWITGLINKKRWEMMTIFMMKKPEFISSDDISLQTKKQMKFLGKSMSKKILLIFKK